ncbi:MAG: aminopeptidase P family protein [Saprospiraceae bacterium]
MKISEKLAALRSAMKAHKVDAYLIPSSDPHQSEYLADHWKSRQWISGFSGSAGTVVVTQGHAGLWTDSRYFIQAEEQLKDSGIELHKLTIPHTPEHLTWLKESLPEGSVAGLDGRLFSVGQIRAIAKQFYNKKIDLNTDTDLIGQIWKDRPPMPQSPVFQHDVKYTGKTIEEKLQQVRERMKAAYYLVSTLDDIAWLFNLRGTDVDCNPVFYAYSIIGKEAAYLFIELSKVSPAIKADLNKSGVILKPYGTAEDFLKNLAEGNIQIDLASTSNQFYNALDKDKILEGENIVAHLKAIKNEVEIGHIHQAMRKDGAALVQLFRWLEKEVKQRPIPEAEVAEKLIGFHKAQGDYFGESFDAIVGYNANGAIVHYRATFGACANIQPEGILLLDSGGQYLDGTTDITRTIALSRPSDEQKRDFTLVLKGMINLTLARFPKGTTGVQLDTLARQYLWQHHYNYGHGTGHGVGFFLSVHEPPQGFSPVANTPRSSIPIEPGMLTSNEPGLYKAGQYGIRIENLVLCVKDGEENEFAQFYKFETVTLFPIDTNLVEKSMLSVEELAWLNAYHAEVFEKLAPLLNEEETTWLKSRCAKI